MTSEIDGSDEEDYEGYFLKPPLNSYNIHEKIKQANEELYLELEQSKATNIAKEKNASERRVTFSAILEFEPDLMDDAVANVSESSIESVLQEEAILKEVEEEAASLSDKEVVDVVDEVVAESLLNTMRLSPFQSSAEEEEIGEEIGELRETMPSIDIKKDLIISVDKEAFKTVQRVPKKERKEKEKSKNKEVLAENNLTLNLKFRICCEYKKYNQYQLPNYIGNMGSEYGVSTSQLLNRERYLEKLKRMKRDMEVKCFQENYRRYEANEKAFSEWLRQKLKNPVNKTKNMYDLKKEKGKIKNGFLIRHEKK